MKKLLIYSVLVIVACINMAAGCGAKANDPQPDSFQSLIGKWEAQRAAYNITKQDGSMLQSTIELKSKGTIIVWEFFSDGRLVATQDGKSREVRWKLNVTKLYQGDIEQGTLTIIGEEEKKLATSLGQSGDLTYAIQTVAAPGTATRMGLSVDVTKIGPYKQNVLVNSYHKL